MPEIKTSLLLAGMLESDAGITEKEGERFYDWGKTFARPGHVVIFNFKGINVVTSDFMSAFIGRLLHEYPEDFDRFFRIENLTAAGAELVPQMREVANARRRL